MPCQGALSFIQEYLPLASYLRSLISPSLGGKSKEGFQDVEERRSSPGEQDLFGYPWAKSSLTSMPVDLKQLKKLDAYAREVSIMSNLENLVSVLLQEAHSDLEKVRAIWMWICHHIEYDVAKKIFKTEDVLQSGKGVCAGYAALFADMCRIAGIGCRYVMGYIKTYPGRELIDINEKRHAWNAVYIDGRWHLLDCTWASGHVENDKFKFNYREFYFLTHPAIFINDHFPEDSSWQLLKPTVSAQEFESSMRQPPIFFSQQLIPAPPGTSDIRTEYNGAKACSEPEDVIQSGKTKDVLQSGKNVCAEHASHQKKCSYEEFDFRNHPAIFINKHSPEPKKVLTLSEQESRQNRQLSLKQVEAPPETPDIKTAPASFWDKLFSIFLSKP